VLGSSPTNTNAPIKAVIDRRYALADVREACLIENAVSASGAREILGLDLHTSEDGAG